MWKNFLSYFAERGYDAWALNLRGHHLSGPVDDWGEVGVAEYLEDIDQGVKKMGRMRVQQFASNNFTGMCPEAPDAFHSFQDVIIPIGDFVHRYGDRVAGFGGVDMDNLSHLQDGELRAYVRDILDKCMPHRFALGSGNTVANYIPVRNYLAMLDEAQRWEG